MRTMRHHEPNRDGQVESLPAPTTSRWCNAKSIRKKKEEKKKGGICEQGAREEKEMCDCCTLTALSEPAVTIRLTGTGADSALPCCWGCASVPGANAGAQLTALQPIECA